MGSGASGEIEAVFPSKRDGWIVALLWAADLAMLVAAVEVWRSTAGLGFRASYALSMLLAAGFVLWILYATEYRLRGGSLIVRCGPLRWKIPLDAIEEIVPTRNPLSAPACSLDRLQVRYGGRRVGMLISPRDKEGFLREVAERSAGLVVEAGKAVRRAGES